MSLVSLYDEASLWMTPSGAKDGKLYSIKPVPEYGSEQVTNGDFATDSDWVLTQATISNGKLLLSTFDGSYTAASQTLGVIGKTYRVSLDVADIVGIVSITIGGGTDFDITSNGTHSFEITSTTTTLEVKRKFGITNVSATIDNVSVKEVLVGDGDFTFSRGSNLAATRVDVNGLIEKGRENLLLQSNQFNTTWDYTNNTLVSGQSGYDGSNNAWFVTKIPASYVPLTQSVSVSGVNTFSFYAKAGTAAFVRTYIPSGNWIINFDFASGNATNEATTNGLISYSMTSVGNGWYRCSSTHSGSITEVRIYNEWAQTNASTYYVQDAQLEIGLAATDYIESGATTAQAGVLENEPRLDYSGGASCPSLLLEPQRTNIFEQSEYFSGTYWGKTGTGGGNAPVVTQNYAVSPEGLQNASRVQFDTNGSTSAHRSGLVRDFAFTTGDKYAISCWVKATSGNSEIFTFRIAGEQVGGEKTATNEWQLFTETHTATVTTTDDFGMQIRGNYSSQTSDILIYGMQLESAVSYPTSYIPTYGTSQTRSKDLANNQSLNPVLGNGNISVMYDFVYDVVGREGSGQIFILYSGNNSLGIKGTQPTDRRMQLFSYGDFSGTIGFNEDVPYQTRHKVVLRVTGEVVELFYNGVKQNNTIDASALGGVYNWSRIKLDPTNAILAGLNQLAVFSTALTDSECIALTKLD